MSKRDHFIEKGRSNELVEEPISKTDDLTKEFRALKSPGEKKSKNFVEKLSKPSYSKIINIISKDYIIFKRALI